MANSGSIFHGHGPIQQAGILVTGNLETYIPPKNWNESNGTWKLEKDFLTEFRGHNTKLSINRGVVIYSFSLYLPT